MKPQNQPMILPHQVFAACFELVLIPILLSLNVGKYIINYVIMMLWITLSEMLAPIILKKAKIYGVTKSLLFYSPFYGFIFPLISHRNNPEFNLFAIVSGAVSVCILLFINRKEIEQILNCLESRRPISKRNLMVQCTKNLIPIISEEILFRGYWISCNISSTEISLIFSSALLFVYAHYINRWANVMYKLKNYIMLFVLGIVLAFVFIRTNSLLYCCLLHFAYNISDFILLMKRYKAKENLSLFDDYG